jgi:TolB-like protein
MHPKRLFTTLLIATLSGHVFAETQDIDKELTDLCERLAVPIQDHGKKKVTVVDFADLHGNSSELGKYIAEQLTVDLVMAKRTFSVLDRANLNSILAEHKLTSKGLVDPENAKQIGKFAGVDALILGDIIPKDQTIMLTAKIITTDTAEIVGAARAEFKKDQQVEKMLAQPAPSGPGSSAATAAEVVKTYGDLQVRLQSLMLVKDDTTYELSMVLTNKNPRKSIWVGLVADQVGIQKLLKSRLTDPSRGEFRPSEVSGIAVAVFSRYGYSGYANTFAPITEIPANESITSTLSFVAPDRRAATAGQCQVQFDVYIGNTLNQNRDAAENVTSHTISAQLNAE